MAPDLFQAAEGDVVEMKKAHPCGGKSFEVMYIGMDVRLKCLSCGSQVRLPRKKFEKMVRRYQKRES